VLGAPVLREVAAKRRRENRLTSFSSSDGTTSSASPARLESFELGDDAALFVERRQRD
jgi:hypothetical protein